MIIFVAGVYGVGKSSTCALLSKKLQIPWLSASNIIKDERGSATWGKQKLTEKIEENQILLLRGIQRALRSQPNLIIDGHFSLLDKDMRVTPIGEETLTGLNISIIVLLEDSPPKISKRLFDRDGIKWPNSLLQELIDTEKSLAIQFHKDHEIPLGIFKWNAVAEIADFLESSIATKRRQ